MRICSCLSVNFQSRCLASDVMSQLHCHGCPATVVTSLLSCLSWHVFLLSSGHIVSLSYLGCTMLTVFSGCPVQAFLSQLSCHNILVPTSCVPAVLSLLLCSLCPVQSAVSHMP
jgi:hypothetical protein